MARFIQGAPEVANTGIGNQSPVGAPRPNLGETISQAASAAAGAVETAGQIYGENRSKEMVNQEIGNVDAAIAAAEDRKKLPSNIVNPNMPESVNVSKAEFDLIQNAVNNGSMSREKARLLVSSRLRTRIAEEPLYAKQLRQSASQVLGFNIESEPARQYFAAFQTERQLQGSNRQTYAQKKWEEAEAIAAGMQGVSVEGAYKAIIEAEYSEIRKKSANAKLAMDAINSDEWASEWITEDSVEGFNSLMGHVATPMENGQPVDNVTLNSRIEASKQAAVAQFTADFEANGGIVGTAEFGTKVSQIKERYDGYKSFVEEIGIDNLQTVQLERTKRAYQVLGDKLFPQMRFAIQNFGQQAATDLLDVLARASTPDQRELLLANRPTLKAMYETLGQNNQEFLTLLNSTAQGLMSGRPLNEDEEEVADDVAAELHQQGSAEGKKNVTQGLADQGKEYKGLSLIADSSPRLEPKENVEYFKRMYDQALPMKMSQFARTISQLDGVTWSVADDGMINITGPAVSSFGVGLARPTSSPSLRRQMGEVREAQRLANQINQYAVGHNNGWSREVGENLDQYKIKLNTEIGRSIDEQRRLVDNELFNTMQGYLESGQTDKARDAYAEINRRNPGTLRRDFEFYQNQARRELGEQ